MAAFASEGGELVDDDEARSWSLRGDAHKVEQNPGADLGRQRVHPVELLNDRAFEWHGDAEAAKTQLTREDQEIRKAVRLTRQIDGVHMFGLKRRVLHGGRKGH